MHQFSKLTGFVILLLGIVHSMPGDINVNSQLVSHQGHQRKIETRSANVCKDSGRSKISCRFLGKKEESIRKEKCVRNSKCLKTCQKCGYSCTSGFYTPIGRSVIKSEDGKGCLLQIVADTDMMVSFEEFNMTESGNTCEHYVEVIKDDCSMEKFCGSNGTDWTTNVTIGENIIFKFMTNDETIPFMLDQRPHFKLIYEQAILCRKETSGVIKMRDCLDKFLITSPNYPNEYPKDENVLWSWFFYKARGVRMEVRDLDIKDNGNGGCTDTLVMVINGARVKFWCGGGNTIIARNISNPSNQIPIEQVDGALIIRVKPDEYAAVKDLGLLSMEFESSSISEGNKGFRMNLYF